MSHPARVAAELIGWTTVGVSTLKSLQFLKLHLLSRGDLSKYITAGCWAIVTGASEGIGRAFATHLASAGFNIFLIALDDQALKKTGQELAERFASSGVIVEPIGFDFNRPADDPAYEGLFSKIRAVMDSHHQEQQRKKKNVVVVPEVAILVNNVGVNYPFPHYFDETPIQWDSRIINVNCGAQLAMTKFVLPNMKEKKAGAIISMSSVSGQLPAGLLSPYSASKEFNHQFNRALGAEVASFGIDCLAVAPYMVESRMSRRKAGGAVDSASDFAAAALRQVGRTDFTNGTAKQSFVWGSIMCYVMPEPFLQWFTVGANKQVREAGMKVLAKKRAKQQLQEQQLQSKL